MINFEDSIFVAGHKGLAGSAICRALLRKGYKNLITVSKAQLNLKDQKEVKDWFEYKKPNIVILAAAKVGGILANNKYPYDFLIDNILIETNVIQASYENKVKRLLFLSSSCAYPKVCKQPIKEEYLMSSSLEKTNESYALAKLTGMKLCESLRVQNNFDSFSLMPTNLYGLGDNYDVNTSHVFASLIRKFVVAKENSLKEVVCWGDGSPKREFLHVDDLGDACVFCLENFKPLSLENSNENSFSNSFLNVGTGKDISIYDLANLIKEKTGFKGNIKWDKTKPNGTLLKKLDIEKLRSMGWAPKLTLDDGLTRSINEFKKLEGIK